MMYIYILLPSHKKNKIHTHGYKPTWHYARAKALERKRT